MTNVRILKQNFVDFTQTYGLILYGDCSTETPLICAAINSGPWQQNQNPNGRVRKGNMHNLRRKYIGPNLYQESDDRIFLLPRYGAHRF